MDDLFTPNCRHCLLPMIPVASGDTVIWWCDECTPQRPAGLRLAADNHPAAPDAA